MVTIANQKSPWAKLGKNSQNPGTAELAIVTAGLNAPTYWNGIRWIFDTINPTATITVHAAEAIQIGRNLPNFPHGKPRMFHIWGLPTGAPPRHPWSPKLKALVTLTWTIKDDLGPRWNTMKHITVSQGLPWVPHPWFCHLHWACLAWDRHSHGHCLCSQVQMKDTLGFWRLNYV